MNQRKFSWSIFIYILTLCFFSVLVCSESTQSIVVFCDNRVEENAIQQWLAEPTCVEAITYQSDVYFEKEEFFYLLDCKPGSIIDASCLLKSVEYLGKKNKFSLITVTSISSEKGISLHFSFESFWTFKKIKFHGVFQGKNFLGHCYVMNRGDCFDEAKHEHSLVKIREMLLHDGYYNSKVTATFAKDYKTKEISVDVFIEKGKRFTVGKVVVHISGDDDEEDYYRLSGQITQRLARRLSSQRYRKNVINREAVALKSYLGRKGFLQTALELEEYRNDHTLSIDLTWKISVHQKRAFVFFGNKFFSKKDLLEKMLEFGRSAWLLPASLLAEEITRVYKSKGFWNASIVAQEEKERSFFIIQEGARAVIKSVDIYNASHYDQASIRKHCFRKLLRNKYYDDQLYDEATRLLAHMYLHEGFLSCSIIDHSFIPTNNEHEYTLVVTVDEGKKSYVESIVVEGYPALHQEGPFMHYNGEDRAVFNVKNIDEQRDWLVSYFQSQGFPHPRVKPHVSTNDNMVSIVWQVDPGEIVHFGKTIIFGVNTALPFSSVLSLMGYRRGDVWDQEKIKQTFRAFKDLDIFELINLSPESVSKNQEKSVILKIQPDDPYEIRVRSGVELQHVRKYQTFNGLTYKIGGTALMRSPFNVGDIARVDLDFAHSHREVVARYKRPFFCAVPLIGTLQVYSMSYDQPGFVGSVNNIYRLTQNGCSYGLEYNATLLKIGCSAGYEGMTTHIKDPFLQESLIRAINFQPQLVDQMVNYFFVEPTVMVERLDNALNPTSGLLTLCSLKSMIPFQKKYKDTAFLKLLFEQSFFVPVKSAVAAFRFRFGHIFYRDLSAIMPSERFYLGGSHSLRGYEADLAPPLGVFVDEETNEHVVPRGGRSMANINIELRFPIFKKFGGVIFQDIGILSSDIFADFRPHNILAATGFGARFYTPLGPLRFDIGWKWRTERVVERSYAWFLTFGQAF